MSDDAKNKLSQNDIDGMTIDEIADAVEASADSTFTAAQSVKVPVAWRWRIKGDNRWTFLDHYPEGAMNDRSECEPLYRAVPQTAPLTEFRKLQDIIDSQADRILDLESMVNELHHALTSPVTRPPLLRDEGDKA